MTDCTETKIVNRNYRNGWLPFLLIQAAALVGAGALAFALIHFMKP
jgi:hypothetical protein